MSSNDEQKHDNEDWERQHEHVANALFELAADISQLIVEYYYDTGIKCNNHHRYKKVKSAIYNEWGITEDMLHITFQWPSDNDNNDDDDDIVIVLRNQHKTPYLDIDGGGKCPKALQDTLLQSHLIQRFVHLDEEYGTFVQMYP